MSSTEKSALAIAAAVIAFFDVMAFVAAPARAEARKSDLAKFNSSDGTPQTCWVYRSESAVHGQCGGAARLRRLVCTHGLTPGADQCAQPGHGRNAGESGYTVIYPDSMGPRGETAVCTEKGADHTINLNHRRAAALATRG